MASTAVEPPGDLILCPLCDYNLRGLTEPRCPECGYTFDWAELRDPQRRRHPYLFEHHPERNVRSFLRTLAGSMCPRRFWRKLFPTQPSAPRRLLLYCALVASLVAGPFLGLLAYRVYRLDQQFRAQRAMQARSMTPQLAAAITAQHGSVQAWMDQFMPVFPSEPYFRFTNIAGWWQLGGYFQLVAFALLWPWMTFVSLLVFRASMRRARVRPAHVLRCVIYAADAAVLAALIIGLLWFFYDSWFARGWYWGGTWWSLGNNYAVSIALGTMFALLTYRLWIAYRQYLRFDHALATAIASQLMIALLTLKLMADFFTSSWGR